MKTDKKLVHSVGDLKLVSIFKSFFGTWSISQTGTLKTKLLSEDTPTTPCWRRPLVRILKWREGNSPTPEIYTPLKATGVFTKKNPELEFFFQETGVPFQQT